MTTQHDAVHAPKHYTDHPVFTDHECYEYAKYLDHGAEFSAFKYAWRYGEKDNPLQDLRKAEWYVDKLISDEASQPSQPRVMRIELGNDLNNMIYDNLYPLVREIVNEGMNRDAVKYNQLWLQFHAAMVCVKVMDNDPGAAMDALQSALRHAKKLYADDSDVDVDAGGKDEPVTANVGEYRRHVVALEDDTTTFVFKYKDTGLVFNLDVTLMVNQTLSVIEAGEIEQKVNGFRDLVAAIVFDNDPAIMCDGSAYVRKHDQYADNQPGAVYMHTHTPAGDSAAYSEWITAMGLLASLGIDDYTLSVDLDT